MARYNFYPNICFILIEKILEFCHIVEHEGILTELNFNENFLFHIIYLFECSRN